MKMTNKHRRKSFTIMEVTITMVITAIFFFFVDTATTDIYTLSLHDALPISVRRDATVRPVRAGELLSLPHGATHQERDRKSTRLNSSHPSISYAVFCLKKKTENRESSSLIYPLRGRNNNVLWQFEVMTNEEE